MCKDQKLNKVLFLMFDSPLKQIGGELGFITPLGPGRITAEYNTEQKRANFSLHLGYAF